MHRWKLSALAAATVVSTAFIATNASALTLGALRVDSALGENLRAEIAIPQATPAELERLAAQIAAPEIFRAQGMDYSAAARSIQVQLVRKPDGTASLQLRSNTPIQDPFVDLVLETRWNTGSLVRSYTLLLDPPATTRTTPQPTVTPQVTAPASVTGRTYSSNGATRPSVAAPATPAPAAADASAEDSVRVRSGDTAGRIANANRPAGVSLDQMLVAMLRHNPKAFVNGNVNRLRAGTVLQLPSREQALETSAQEARQIVAAQSRDFNAYRRSLASKAPQAAVQAADRTSGGQVQAHVAETRPSTDATDKLTLSKAAAQDAAAEEKLAVQKQVEAQDSRLNELQRNLAELNELAKSNTAAATPVSAEQAAASAPTAAEPATPAANETPATPTLDVTSAAAATAESNAASAPESASSAPAEAAASGETAAPAATTAAAPAVAEAPKPAATPKPAAPAPTPVAEASLLDDPLVPAGAGLVAILLGLLGYTAWKRRRAAQAEQDPNLNDSELHPDTFFAGSGGQQVDTSSAEGTASTMAYAPSQLDGGGDVDPVAEADVYLAYGRDVQAEEILKEALRTQPERLSVHAKLAEIYVKRNDAAALEDLARRMQPVAQPDAPEWQRVMELGRQIAPQNPLFAETAASAPAQPSSAFAAALQASAAQAAVSTASEPELPPLDLDLNVDTPAATAKLPEMADPLDSVLDLSTASDPTQPPTLVQDTVMGTQIDTTDGLDLDLSGFELPSQSTAPASVEPETPMEPVDSLNIDLDAELPPVAEAPVEPAAPEVPAPAASLDFDLGSLDLDLGPSPEPADNAQPVHNQADDPLSTKLDLAQEFNSIGDSEGARALIEEVLAEAGGSLKARAQKMLSELD